MPALAGEPMVYPSNLFDDDVTPRRDAEDAVTDRTWRVAHTKPRQEKALARHLHSTGVSFFLPLCRKVIRRNRHRQLSWNPVFPGYLFFQADEHERVEALRSNRIASLLDVYDPYELVADLHRVYRLISSDLPLFPEQRLRPGAPVRITSGPLKGLDGTIERHKSASRFVVAVSFIQQAVSAEIDACEIEPITDATPSESSE
jgi:transcriptional antiterminator RfaH